MTATATTTTTDYNNTDDDNDDYDDNEAMVEREDVNKMGNDRVDNDPK